VSGDRYEEAGVSLEAAERTVALIRAGVRATRPEVVEGIGGFAGVFRLDSPARLVAGCDGVGSKVLVAAELNRWDDIGVDLVAMCVNDVLTLGAEPLFFLDYVAVGRLRPEAVAAVVASVDRACAAVGAALLGGETAEMPGLYADGHMDLAGFAVGRVLPDRVPPPPVLAGHRILGLASNGLHANGFSLVRHIRATAGWQWSDPVPGGDRTWADEVLAPTRLYVRPVLEVIRRHPVAAMAHITGGGLPGNLPRVLAGRGARIQAGSWPEPPVFAALAEAGGVSRAEMRRVFNCGIGYCLVVPAEAAKAVGDTLTVLGERVWDIGVVTGASGVAWE
jgi:phosphoribosylformylglycinamidine cyclo-ligase